MLPVILVSADRRDPGGFHDSPRIRPRRSEAYVYEVYLDAVRVAGGTPLVLPPGDSDLDAILSAVHGVVLTGGDMDIHPSLYGQQIQGRIDRIEPGRTHLELDLARRCLERNVPILGVCGGMQVLAVAGGSTLIQDLPMPDTGPPGTLRHEQPTDPAEAWHAVQVQAPADRWLGAEIQVNSTHHQAVDALGEGIIACGRAPDGVIEVIAFADHPYAVGVQWHPELLGQFGVYEGLVQAAHSLLGTSSSDQVPLGP